ncbi:hypothetical protein SSTU70S_06564 [Stutzerimonas stutzeri]
MMHLLQSSNRVALSFCNRPGYGTATRDYFFALHKHLAGKKIDLLGIDSSEGNIVGDTRKISCEKDGSKWAFKFPENSQVYVICHEVASYFRFLVPNGRIRFIGLTVHEFREQIQQECDPLSLPQELWVPSLWNKNLIIETLGFADDYVKVLPHTYPSAHDNDSETGVTFKKLQKYSDGKVTFLLIVSNVERKNASRTIAAFISEFTSSDQVRMIVKLPGNLSQSDLEDKVLPSPAFLQKTLAPEIILVRENFTDAEMHFLHDISDAIINAETSKGFDLDSMLMLGKGKQVVATLAGGFTEYANNNNIYPIDCSESSFFNRSEYNNKKTYGNIVAGAPGISDICTALRACSNDLLRNHHKNNTESALCIRQFYSASATAERIMDFVYEKTEDHDFLSLHKPELVIDKEKPYSKTTFKFQALSEPEAEKLNSELRHPLEFSSKDDWLKDRREIFGSYGTIPPTKAELGKLAKLKGRHEGKRCFIIGNGPSLNKTNLELLKNEFTFCANKFYLKLPDLSWTPSFYTCLDWRVTPDDSENIQTFFKENPDVLKFLPNRFKHLLLPDPNTYWYESISSGRYLDEKFEIDATKCVRGGGTVATAMIQLAAFLGFKDIYLIGTDVTYVIPDTVKQDGRDRFNTGVKINLTSTANDDPNHFSPAYFGAGARWHDPNVPEMKRGFRASYLAAKLKGVNVYNATAGGSLNCIPRVNFNDLF